MAMTKISGASTELNRNPVYEKYTPRQSASLAAQIWKHFLREKEGQSAKCCICEKTIQSANGSTGGLKTHLKSIHKMEFNQDNSITEPEAETETTSEPELSHLKKLKRRFTRSKPADIAVDKVNQLEEALRVFRSEVDLKLKIMQQILTTRNEQVSVQKKLLEREQSLFDTLLGHWMNASELASTGQSVNLAEPAADDSDGSAGDEEYQYQSDPDYSLTEQDDFGQPPVRKKSKSSLRRKRKSRRSYSEQNEASGSDAEIVKYSDSEHTPLNVVNCNWAEGNNATWEPNVEVVDKSGNEADFGQTDYLPPETTNTNEERRGQYEQGLPKRMKREEDSDSTLRTYEEYSDGNHSTDKLWQWFLRETGGQSAKCKLCQKVLKCSKSSPTGLRSHIKRIHQIELD